MSRKIHTGLYEFKGLNTRDPAHLLADGELRVAQGVSFDDLGMLSKRLGRVRKATIAAQPIDYCDSLTGWSISDSVHGALSLEATDIKQGIGAVKVAINLRSLENCDTVSNWTSGDNTNFALSQETVDKQEGTGAVKVTAQPSLPVLDQSQTNFTSWSGLAGDQLAQTFKPSVSAFLAKIEVPLAWSNPSIASNVNVEIRSDSGGVPGTQLAFKAISGTDIPVTPNYGWITVSFAGLAVSLSAGATYWIIVTYAYVNNNVLYWGSSSADVYSNGAAYYSSDNGSSWVLFGNDFAFNQYYAISEAYYIDRDLGVGGIKDLSKTNKIAFRIKTSTTANLIFSMGEASPLEQTKSITTTANTWMDVVWDISGITPTARDAIRYLRLAQDGYNSAGYTILLDDIREYEIPPLYIERDLGVGIDLSVVNFISFWVKDLITQAMRFSMGEAAGNEQNYDFTTLINTYEKIIWDISGIPATARDAIRYLRLASQGVITSNTTWYLDDIEKPPAPVIINSGKRYSKSDGAKLTVVAADQTLYSVDDSFAFTSIGTGFTTGKRFNYAVFNDKLIASNGYENLKAWTGVGVVADLAAGAPTAAKYPLVYKNYLFVVVGQYTLQWSALADETSWPTNNTINFDKNDGDWITGIATLGVEGGLSNQAALVVFKNKAVYIVYGSDFTNGGDIEVQKVIADHGCIAPNSIKPVDGNLIFLAHDGIRVFNGQRSELIAKRIKPTLDNINRAAIDKVSAVIYNRQYILSYPDGNSVTANKYIRGHIDRRMSNIPNDFDIAWLGPENIGHACFILYDAPGETIKLYASDSMLGNLYQIEVGNDDDGAAIALNIETGDMSLSPDELPDYITSVYIQKENTTSNSNPLTVNLCYDEDYTGVDFIIDDQKIQNKLNTIACGRGYRHRLKFSNSSIFPLKLKGFTRGYEIKRIKRG